MTVEHTAPSDVTDAQIENFASRIYTQLLGKIESYDETTQKAAVRITSKVNGISLPPLRNLPVQWPSGIATTGEAWSLTGPLASGCVVTVMVLTLPIDEFLEKGEADVDTVKGSRWRFNLSNAYVVPGLSPFCDPLPADAVDSTSPVLRGDPVLLGDALASALVALGPDTDTRFAELKSWIQNPTTGLGPQVAAFITLATPIVGPAPWIPTIPSTQATKVKAT